MPSDHDACSCAPEQSQQKEKGCQAAKTKPKTNSPKSNPTVKKKVKSKKKDEISADAILAKIAELEAGKGEASVVPEKSAPLQTTASPKMGLHIPSDLREKYLNQVALTARERREIALHQSKIDQLVKEKDGILSQISKVEEKKQKLDTLCKQLQARNKEILESVRERGEDEQGLRKELSEKFSSTITDITAKMEMQQTERLKMAEENDQLRVKIEEMKDVILSREDTFKALHEKKEAEVQKLQQKLKDVEVKAVEEESKFEEWKNEIAGQSVVVDSLRDQLQNYSGKFEAFQSTLSKSNPVFQSYKLEMDMITKRIRLLDHENQQLRLKTLKTDHSILDLFEERNKDMSKLSKLEEQNATLQQLAKDLNAQRAELKLKAQK
jgi:chromosome segregation ATPase